MSIAARIQQTIADELVKQFGSPVRVSQVEAAIALLDEGASVPFIARYRKERTGSLDDSQLRLLEERLRYLRELEERRSAIVASIEEQGKLSAPLAAQIQAAVSKAELEDLYLPYKPKRRSKGQIAIEAGLLVLADKLLENPALNPEMEAAAFIDSEKGFADVKAVLEGAKYILMERFAEDASVRGQIRQFLKENAQLSARLIEGKAQEGAKFRDYFEHNEPLSKVPSHRALAIFRARNEGVLSVNLKTDEQSRLISKCLNKLFPSSFASED